MMISKKDLDALTDEFDQVRALRVFSDLLSFPFDTNTPHFDFFISFAST